MKRQLKIGLFPLHSFARPGGVKSHVLALKKELKRRGHSVKIIVPRSLPFEKYGKDIKLFGTSFPIPFSGSLSDFTVCLTPGSIDQLLKKEKFDILHFHNFGLHSWQILEKSRATNILTFHACTTFQKLKANPLFKIFPLFSFFKKSILKMDGIIGIAPFNIQLVKKMGYKGKTAVIPNGIDLEKFNPQVTKIKKYLDGKINLLFVGRIEERKGLIYLLKAYRILRKRHKNLRLIVVGEGSLKQEYQNWVKQHKLKGIIFEKKVKTQSIPSYYTTCDIFVAPAIFGESFGIVLLEAMASGKPVVAFANRGYKRVLSGKGKEFLVQPRDYESLAQKIEILIKNKQKREEMAEWGLREVQRYAWPKIADQVLNFYQEVLS